MTAQLSGPDYGLHLDFPDILAEQIRDSVEKYPDASLIELRADGASIQTTSRALHERALRICRQIASIDPEVPLILCFEHAVDFVPAAWAATRMRSTEKPFATRSSDTAARRARANVMACSPSTRESTRATRSMPSG